MTNKMVQQKYNSIMDRRSMHSEACFCKFSLCSILGGMHGCVSGGLNIISGECLGLADTARTEEKIYCNFAQDDLEENVFVAQV